MKNVVVQEEKARWDREREEWKGKQQTILQEEQKKCTTRIAVYQRRLDKLEAQLQEKTASHQIDIERLNDAHALAIESLRAEYQNDLDAHQAAEEAKAEETERKVMAMQEACAAQEKRWKETVEEKEAAHQRHVEALQQMMETLERRMVHAAASPSQQRVGRAEPVAHEKGERKRKEEEHKNTTRENTSPLHHPGKEEATSASRPSFVSCASPRSSGCGASSLSTASDAPFSRSFASHTEKRHPSGVPEAPREAEGEDRSESDSESARERRPRTTFATCTPVGTPRNSSRRTSRSGSSRGRSESSARHHSSPSLSVGSPQQTPSRLSPHPTMAATRRQKCRGDTVGPPCQGGGGGGSGGVPHPSSPGLHSARRPRSPHRLDYRYFDPTSQTTAAAAAAAHPFRSPPSPPPPSGGGTKGSPASFAGVSPPRGGGGGGSTGGGARNGTAVDSVGPPLSWPAATPTTPSSPSSSSLALPPSSSSSFSALAPVPEALLESLCESAVDLTFLQFSTRYLRKSADGKRIERPLQAVQTPCSRTSTTAGGGGTERMWWARPDEGCATASSASLGSVFVPPLVSCSAVGSISHEVWAHRCMEVERAEDARSTYTTIPPSTAHDDHGHTDGETWRCGGGSTTTSPRSRHHRPHPHHPHGLSPSPSPLPPQSPAPLAEPVVFGYTVRLSWLPQCRSSGAGGTRGEVLVGFSEGGLRLERYPEEVGGVAGGPTNTNGKRGSGPSLGASPVASRHAPTSPGGGGGRFATPPPLSTPPLSPSTPSPSFITGTTPLNLGDPLVFREGRWMRSSEAAAACSGGGGGGRMKNTSTNGKETNIVETPVGFVASLEEAGRRLQAEACWNSRRPYYTPHQEPEEEEQDEWRERGARTPTTSPRRPTTTSPPPLALSSTTSTTVHRGEVLCYFFSAHDRRLYAPSRGMRAVPLLPSSSSGERRRPTTSPSRGKQPINEEEEEEEVLSTVIQCVLHLREACITYTVHEEIRSSCGSRSTPSAGNDRRRKPHPATTILHEEAEEMLPSRRNGNAFPSSASTAVSWSEWDGTTGVSMDGPEEQKKDASTWRVVCTDLIGFNQVDISKPLYPAVEVNADGAVVEII